jgi:hypothetical protein
MELLKQPYGFNKQELCTLLILGAGAGYVLLLACVPEAQTFSWKCPLHDHLNLFCPGCGLTRACIALVKLEFGRAFLQNPLVYVVTPWVAYRLGSISVGLVTGHRVVGRWPKWFVHAYQMLFLALWSLLAGVRVAAWAAPSTNPAGLLLPF